MSSTARDVSLDALHPEFRSRVQDLQTRLAAEALPFQIFEGFRAPTRQAYLYSQGRTRPGRIVTWAGPWSSYHQYGVAADFVVYEEGRWSWDDSGDRIRRWIRLHELGRDVGLKPLSWERPHLQMADVSLDALRSGRYPDGGDPSWAENLASAIYGWIGTVGAPPVPSLLTERPPLPPEVPAEMEVSPEPAGPWRARFYVTARSGLRLRGGPGVEFDILDTLRPLDEVVILGKHGDWVSVDLQGDGLSDGFCHGDFLSAAR